MELELQERMVYSSQNFTFFRIHYGQMLLGSIAVKLGPMVPIKTSPVIRPIQDTMMNS
jgi:hypothetical protein